MSILRLIQMANNKKWVKYNLNRFKVNEKLHCVIDQWISCVCSVIFLKKKAKTCF